MINDQIKEVIFLGLPGPTHHYAGLSPDNVASNANRGSVSNPKQAALQVLELARLLKRLGVEVALLPPQLRPHLPLLRQHFTGGDESVIRQAYAGAPALLEQACSSAAMWSANSATVAPVPDCDDAKLHITVANLFTNLHRRIEAEDTYRVMKAIFAAVPDCEIYPPLSAAAGLRDEGAANHMRLAPLHDAHGLNVFVYGADGSVRDPESARQTLSASKALKLQHHIPDERTLFLRQNPHVIRQGVFHNDVIAVGNEYVLLVHESAYQDGRSDIDRIAKAYYALYPNKELCIVAVEDEELSVEEAVHTYFFNSQIVTRSGGAMAIIAPAEVESLYDGKAAKLMRRIVADKKNPINEMHIADLRQSMKNGGGPACLRLRVPMTEVQLAALKADGRALADDMLLASIERIIHKHYPETLTPQNLGNPALYHICRSMLEELAEAMRLPLLP